MKLQTGMLVKRNSDGEIAVLGERDEQSGRVQVTFQRPDLKAVGYVWAPEEYVIAEFTLAEFQVKEHTALKGKFNVVNSVFVIQMYCTDSEAALVWARLMNGCQCEMVVECEERAEDVMPHSVLKYVPACEKHFHV